jgi:hypothetical protein
VEGRHAHCVRFPAPRAHALAHDRISLSLYLCLYLCLCPPPPLSLSLSGSLCIFACVSPSLSLCVVHTHTCTAMPRSTRNASLARGGLARRASRAGSVAGGAHRAR